jgi:hypothetical protein
VWSFQHVNFAINGKYSKKIWQSKLLCFPYDLSNIQKCNFKECPLIWWLLWLWFYRKSNFMLMATNIRRNLIHSDIWLQLLMRLMSKSTTSITIVRLVLCVILVVNVYVSKMWLYIYDYNVDITKWSCKCNYNLWLSHVWMEK